MATVKQIGNNFKTGIQRHIHEPQPRVATACAIHKEVKATALSQIFESAAEIRDEVISGHIDNDEPLPSLPAPANVAKAANHHRHNHHPKDPVTLDLNVAEDFILEGFCKKDVKVGTHHHFISATDKMIELLSLAKNWFINAAFKVVKSPFTQILSMHEFIKSSDSWKQFPLPLHSCWGSTIVTTRKFFKLLYFSQ